MKNEGTKTPREHETSEQKRTQSPRKASGLRVRTSLKAGFLDEGPPEGELG